MNQEKNYEAGFFVDPTQEFRPFTNDFIFMNVMRHPKICRGILELILPNEEIGAIRIKRSDNPFVDNSEIDEESDENASESHTGNGASGQAYALENLSTETQKTLKLAADAHGVRFDAFVESSKLWANIGRRVPRAKALHSWHETCLASAECSALSIGGLGAGGLRLQNAARKNSA